MKITNYQKARIKTGTLELLFQITYLKIIIMKYGGKLKLIKNNCT